MDDARDKEPAADASPGHCQMGVVVCNYMLTVPEAAKRVGRDPETVRRWIRAGKLRSQRIGTQHLIDEDDLAELEVDDIVPLPRAWKDAQTWTGEPPIDWGKAVRRSRESH